MNRQFLYNVIAGALAGITFSSMFFYFLGYTPFGFVFGNMLVNIAYSLWFYFGVYRK